MTSLSRQILTRAILLVALTFFANGCQRSTHNDRPGSTSVSGSNPTSGGSGSDRSYQPRASESQQTYKQPRLKTPAKSESLRKKLASRIRDAFNRNSIQQDEVKREYILRGGADPSGGQGLKSTKQDLKDSVRKAFEELPGFFHRFKFWLEHDRLSGERFQILKKCYDNKPETCQQNIYETITKMIQSFDFNKDFVDGDCPSANYHDIKDMSIDANLKLCVSHKLTRYSENELYFQVIGLLNHQIVHGLQINAGRPASSKNNNENKARELQKFTAENKSLTRIEVHELQNLRVATEDLLLELAKTSHLLTQDPINHELVCKQIDSSGVKSSNYTFLFQSKDKRLLSIPLKFYQISDNIIFYYIDYTFRQRHCEGETEPFTVIDEGETQSVAQKIIEENERFIQILFEMKKNLEDYLEKPEELFRAFSINWSASHIARLSNLLSIKSFSDKSSPVEALYCSLSHKGQNISEKTILLNSSGYQFGLSTIFDAKDFAYGSNFLSFEKLYPRNEQNKRKPIYYSLLINTVSHKDKSGLGVRIGLNDDSKINKFFVKSITSSFSMDPMVLDKQTSTYHVLSSGENLHVTLEFEDQTELAGKEIEIDCQPIDTNGL